MPDEGFASSKQTTRPPGLITLRSSARKRLILATLRKANPFKAQLKAEGLPYKTILDESSAKTIKGQKIGFLTAICYLVPSEKLCPHAKLAEIGRAHV
jgi:hypothetical protein